MENRGSGVDRLTLVYIYMIYSMLECQHPVNQVSTSMPMKLTKNGNCQLLLSRGLTGGCHLKRPIHKIFRQLSTLSTT